MEHHLPKRSQRGPQTIEAYCRVISSLSQIYYWEEKYGLILTTPSRIQANTRTDTLYYVPLSRTLLCVLASSIEQKKHVSFYRRSMSASPIRRTTAFDIWYGAVTVMVLYGTMSSYFMGYLRYDAKLRNCLIELSCNNRPELFLPYISPSVRRGSN